MYCNTTINGEKERETEGEKEREPTNNTIGEWVFPCDFERRFAWFAKVFWMLEYARNTLSNYGVHNNTKAQSEHYSVTQKNDTHTNRVKAESFWLRFIVFAELLLVRCLSGAPKQLLLLSVPVFSFRSRFGCCCCASTLFGLYGLICCEMHFFRAFHFISILCMYHTPIHAYGMRALLSCQMVFIKMSSKKRFQHAHTHTRIYNQPFHWYGTSNIV